jgi:thiol-disulfide isomerase/thioredoxin
MSRIAGILCILAIVACWPGTPQVPRTETTLGLIEARPDLAGQRVGAAPGATLAFVFASWCSNCHDELAVIDRVRAAHPQARILGINYQGHEEYDNRGSSAAVKAYVAEHAPWLRVVPADEALFAALGRPRFVPTLYVFKRDGGIAARFDRGDRPMPSEAELHAVLAEIE